eukprot:364914-Chlamydomonas_euryale.AAC.13
MAPPHMPPARIRPPIPNSHSARQPHTYHHTLTHASQGVAAADDDGPAAAHTPPVWRTTPHDEVVLHSSCVGAKLPSTRFPQPYVVFLEKVWKRTHGAPGGRTGTAPHLAPPAATNTAWWPNRHLLGN